MKGFTIWFTGPGSADRNYLARMVEESLLERGIKVELIAEESAGAALFEGIGSSQEEREIAAGRAAYVSQLLTRNDVISIVSIDSPYSGTRDEVRDFLGSFCEVHVKGELPEGCPFEEPSKPEVVVSMDEDGEDKCTSSIVRTLELMKLIPAEETSAEYSSDEEEKITKRLKDLGYI
jgi:adenylylsulfate kinase